MTFGILQIWKSQVKSIDLFSEQVVSFYQVTMLWTWEETKQRVRTFREQQQALPNLRDFFFHPCTSKVLYFLALDPHGESVTMIYSVLCPSLSANSPNAARISSLLIPLAQPEIEDDKVSFAQKYDWRPALSLSWLKRHMSPPTNGNKAHKSSVGHKGVTDIQVTDERILFTYYGELWTAIFPSANAAMDGQVFQPFRVFPPKDSSQHEVTYQNATIGGLHHDLIAYVRNRDIWLVTLDGLEARLTMSGDTPGCTISNGLAEYVMQEEFHRFTGYVWAPSGGLHGQRNTNALDVAVVKFEENLKILYAEVDESMVETIHFHDTGMDSLKYPRAGKKNAITELRLLEFSWNGSRIKRITRKRLMSGHSLKERFPWMEYVVRFGWLPDASKYAPNVWAQLMDRLQQRTAYVRIPLILFVGEDDTTASKQAAIEVIYEETSTTWLNVSDFIYFLPPDPSFPSDCTRFIIASEMTGFRHLYLVASYNLQFRTRALTAGDFIVLNSQIAVHPTYPYVFFLAKMSSPLETSLCAVRYGPLDIPSKIWKFNLPEWSVVNWNFSPLDDLCVVVQSNVKKGMTCEVVRFVIDEAENPGIELAGRVKEIMTIDRDWYIPVPEYFECVNPDGIKIFGLYYLPEDYIRGRQYPALVYVYGGPTSQIVTKEYKGSRHLRLHLASHLGFIVIQVDGRGSCNRGHRFESYIYGRLGQVELKDQLFALNWLANTKGDIDTSRVAITGWSYGGYLALMGLAKYPETFKIAIAGAPVTSWELYDTAYTERYLGSPEENEEGYRLSSVLEQADKFPNDPFRLLVIHGLQDENVHFLHSQRLVEALVNHNKPHHVQVYHGERHGLRRLESVEHYDTLFFWWLLNYL